MALAQAQGYTAKDSKVKQMNNEKLISLTCRRSGIFFLKANVS